MNPRESVSRVAHRLKSRRLVIFPFRCQQTRQVQIAVDSTDLGQTLRARVVGTATERSAIKRSRKCGGLGFPCTTEGLLSLSPGSPLSPPGIIPAPGGSSFLIYEAARIAVFIAWTIYTADIFIYAPVASWNQFRFAEFWRRDFVRYIADLMSGLWQHAKFKESYHE